MKNASVTLRNGARGQQVCVTNNFFPQHGVRLCACVYVRAYVCVHARVCVYVTSPEKKKKTYGSWFQEEKKNLKF